MIKNDFNFELFFIADFPNEVYEKYDIKKLTDKDDTSELFLPYQVRISATTSGSIKCAGTLISKSHVLTSRKCVENYYDKTIYPLIMVTVRFNSTFTQASAMLFMFHLGKLQFKEILIVLSSQNCICLSSFHK